MGSGARPKNKNTDILKKVSIDGQNVVNGSVTCLICASKSIKVDFRQSTNLWIVSNLRKHLKKHQLATEADDDTEDFAPQRIKRAKKETKRSKSVDISGSSDEEKPFDLNRRHW